MDQYTNICANFDFEGARSGNPDRIYLFGFSRGAKAIRAIAGMIAEFGLLEPRDIRHLPVLLDAWNRGEGLQGMPRDIHLMGAEVEFVGLFDSVMGGIENWPLFNPIRFSNLELPGKCKHGLQILAMDDNRFLFRPKRWEGRQPARSAKNKKLRKKRWLRQIWMPGIHSDVGGTGNRIWGEASLLAMTFYLDKQTPIALDPEWIAEKEHGLRASVDQSKFEISPYWRFPPRFPRTGGENRDWSELLHPICDHVDKLRYGKNNRFAWREQVFAKYFHTVDVDDELAAYFRDVLDVHEADEGPADEGGAFEPPGESDLVGA